MNGNLRVNCLMVPVAVVMHSHGGSSVSQSFLKETHYVSAPIHPTGCKQKDWLIYFNSLILNP
jgi:hypothetical protein